MNKIMLMITVVSLACEAISANILWGDATVSYYGQGADWGHSEVGNIYECWWPYQTEYCDLFVGIITADEYKFISRNNEFTTFGMASAGDLICSDFLNGKEIENIIVNVDSGGVYVGFSNFGYYGWVNVYKDETGALAARGAVNTDGDPILVGAVPEPSSALLLLVGLAGLALRRRGEELSAESGEGMDG